MPRRILLISLALMATSPVFADNWPAWRGLRNDGTTAEKNSFPLRWSATENIAWKTEIPGVGHSSPVVWGDYLFLTTCIIDGARGERALICTNRADGAIRWQRTVLAGPLEKKHKLNSYASSTPTTDGKRVWVTFFDPPHIRVVCYDFDGKEIWRKTPGTFTSVHGFCSSPILFENLLIVNCDQDSSAACLLALDKETGEERWRTERPNHTRSYCVPLIVDVAGKKQMVLSGSKCVASYDPHTGEQNWIIQGPTEQYVASMIYNSGVLFMTAGFPEHHVLAIDPAGRGDVTATSVLWRSTKATSYVPSPVAQHGLFFLISDDGIASCFEPKTGQRHWMERLGKHHSASLVAANDYVYFLDDDGNTFVLKASDKFDVVAKNMLKEECYASPALSDGQIFIRGAKHLYCVGRKN